MAAHASPGNNPMNVFISWGRDDLSKRVAMSLRKLLNHVIQGAQVFVSEEMDLGASWLGEIKKALTESNYGILCLTLRNHKTPWINFEAGAIAKLPDSVVCPLLLGSLRNSHLVNLPIGTFQSAEEISKENILKLMRGINARSKVSIDEQVLCSAFETNWPAFEEELSAALTDSDQPAPPEFDSEATMNEIHRIVQYIGRRQYLSLNGRIRGNGQVNLRGEILDEEGWDSRTDQVANLFESIIPREMNPRI